MTDFTVTLELPHPPATLFRFLADPRNRPRWQASLRTVTDVDADGVRIGVKTGSAYDLFLTRTLEHAQLVRGDEGVDVFLAEGLEAGAGIREPVTAFIEQHGGLRVVDGAFMQIRQAVGTTRSRSAETVAFLRDVPNPTLSKPLDLGQLRALVGRAAVEAGR